MIKQILNMFAVTLAFAAGAAATAVLLGMPVAVIPLYLEIAVLAGLAVDSLRFVASKFWNGKWQMDRDIEDIFRSSLA